MKFDGVSIAISMDFIKGDGMSVNLPKTLAETVVTAESSFEARFGRCPSIVVAAPGRVNLIGEHIDYCDGYVMPFAIPAYTVLAADWSDEHTSAIISAEGSFGETEFGLVEKLTPGQPSWANYGKGVIQGFKELGHELGRGIEIQIASDVPLGAGLSSSAALEVAFATLWEQLCGVDLGAKAKALLAQKAEHDFAGVPCGIMDQFASAFGQEGHVVLIDCLKEEAELVPFKQDDLAVLISNTKVSHALSDGAYAERRRQTEQALAALGRDSYRGATMEDLAAVKSSLDEVVFRRARHVISESERTLEAAEVLKKNDFAKLGELMNESHVSLRDDFEVSCRELDVLVDAALEIGTEGGVLGARMTGGGFGGSTVTLCQKDRAASIAAHLSKVYEAKTGIEAQILLVSPADGAMTVPHRCGK